MGGFGMGLQCCCTAQELVWRRRAATKARGWLAIREGRLEALGFATSRLKPEQQWMWFHCASVGEYEQAKTGDEAWRSRIRKMLCCFRFTVLRGGMRLLAASRNGGQQTIT